MPTVLLLGAGSDIATALARKYASLGYNVQLAARSAGRLQPLVSDLRIRHGISASLHEFDAAIFSTHTPFWAALQPRPDITCCIFGYLGDQPKAETDWQECEKILNANFTGAVSILNIVANDYAAKGTGVIVGFSSVAGERGRASNYLYGSAKAGFTAYFSGLRNRLSKPGVRVLTVKPGFVETRMTEGMALPPLLTAKPEQVADAVVKAVKNQRDVIYVKWFWRWIMFIIKSIPESIFKNLNL
jgi:short-subunit dehydrogenase